MKIFVALISSLLFIYACGSGDGSTDRPVSHAITAETPSRGEGFYEDFTD